MKIIKYKYNINNKTIYNNYNMKKYGFSFSWKRALGITSVKQKFARKTGIPTTKAGLERKIGNLILKLFNKCFNKIKKLR